MDIKHSINHILGNIVFQKCDIKEQYVVYGASILSSYGNEKKTYFLAFVPKHLAILDRAYIHELPWQNFQARILPNIYKLTSQRWKMDDDSADVRFTLAKREKAYTEYRPEGGGDYTLLLLHEPKKKSVYQYYNITTLIKALGSYACVLNYEGDSLYTSQPRSGSSASQCNVSSSHGSFEIIA